MTNFTLNDDIIDIEDIITRFEYLTKQNEDTTELKTILDNLEGYSGDVEWNDNWYPLCLIKHTYFTEYIKELCENVERSLEKLPKYIIIDWYATAENCKIDYGTIKVNETLYYYRKYD